MDGSSDTETCSTKLITIQAKARRLSEDMKGKYLEGKQTSAEDSG
jgi:hypothetical protein